MKKIIIGMNGCSRCKSLQAMAPDATYMELDPMDFLPFCRALDIKTMPFVVVVGEPHELAKVLEDKDVQE